MPVNKKGKTKTKRSSSRRIGRLKLSKKSKLISLAVVMIVASVFGIYLAYSPHAKKEANACSSATCVNAVPGAIAYYTNKCRHGWTALPPGGKTSATFSPPCSNSGFPNFDLALNSCANNMAQFWANQMAFHFGLVHMNDPRLGSNVVNPFNAIKIYCNGYNAAAWGENVGVFPPGTGCDSEDKDACARIIARAFIYSPLHLSNIQQGKWHFDGIAIAHALDGTIYVANEFIQ